MHSVGLSLASTVWVLWGIWLAAFWAPDGTFVGQSRYRCFAGSRGKVRGAFPSAVATRLHATLLSAGITGCLLAVITLGFRRLRAEPWGRRRAGPGRRAGPLQRRAPPRESAAGLPAACPLSLPARSGGCRGTGTASVIPAGWWQVPGAQELTGTLGGAQELATSQGILDSKPLKELIGVLNHTERTSPIINCPLPSQPCDPPRPALCLFCPQFPLQRHTFNL